MKNDRITIDRKVLNSILKAIEIHVNLIKECDVRIPDNIERERIYKSVEYLMNIESIIEDPEKDLKNIKRSAYTKYLNAKKNLEEAMKSNNNELINKYLEEKNLSLNYYLSLKEICER